MTAQQHLSKDESHREPSTRDPWTVVERGEFTKALLNRGVPLNPKTNEYDWELFRVRLGINHSANELCAYFNVFLGYCRDLVQRHAVAAEGKPALQGSSKDGIPFETAKIIVLRLVFFFSLRSSVIPHPYLEHFLRSAPRPTGSFPAWWTPEHDRGLLLGVERYGLEDVEAICNDQQLPFKTVANTSPTTPTAPAMINFPSKVDLLKRVEVLCKFVQMASSQPPSTTSTANSVAGAVPASPSPRLAATQSPSALMPPPISPPVRKEKRAAPERRAHLDHDDIKHHRADA